MFRGRSEHTLDAKGRIRIPTRFREILKKLKTAPVEFSTTGHVTMHWSRLLAGAFAFLSALHTMVFAVLIKVVSIWMRQNPELEEQAEQHPLESLAADELSFNERV